MYTILNIVFILLIVASAVLLFLIPIGGMTWRSDMKDSLSYKYIYTDEEKATFRYRIATWPKKILIITLVLIPIFFLSIVGCFITNRVLTEQTCLNNNGKWKQWDSGMQWECYNPNLINQSNNFRIITETPEN